MPFLFNHVVKRRKLSPQPPHDDWAQAGIYVHKESWGTPGFNLFLPPGAWAQPPQDPFPGQGRGCRRSRLRSTLTSLKERTLILEKPLLSMGSCSSGLGWDEPKPLWQAAHPYDHSPSERHCHLNHWV